MTEGSKQAGGPFLEPTSRKVGGPVREEEWCRTMARCVGLRDMAHRNSAGLRAATMTNDTREVRTQKASSEAKRPAGQTESARERKKQGDRPSPRGSASRCFPF